MVDIAEIDCGQRDPSLQIEAKDSYETYFESLMSGGLDHDVDDTIGHRRLKHHHLLDQFCTVVTSNMTKLSSKTFAVISSLRNSRVSL